MSKEVRNRISLDATRFERGVRSVRRDTLSLNKNLQSLGQVARTGAKGIGILAGAIGGASAVIAAGVRNVVNYTAELNHLRHITGETEGNLAILQGAFKDSGVGAGNLDTRINRLRQTISNAERGNTRATEAFQNLGLSVESIAQMGAREQLEAIGEAITKIENPSERAAAAMELFGQRGADMLQLFETGAIADREGLMGEQAALLEKNSDMFERAATQLSRAGEVMRGFFVGVADRIVPAIMPMLDKFEKMAPKLLEAGQRFGEGIREGLATVLGVFENNTLGKIAEESMKIAALGFINAVVRGWVGIIKGVWNMLKAVVSNMITLLHEGMIGAATFFGSKIAEYLADATGMIRGMGGVSKRLRGLQFDAAAVSFRAQRAAEKAGASITGDVLDGFADGMADAHGFNLIDTSKSEKQLASMIANAGKVGRKQIEDEEDKWQTPDRESRGGIDLPMGGDTPDANAQKQFLQGVSSLAEIGGGGGVAGVDALTDQSRKQTGLLREIKDFNRQIRDTIASLPGGQAGMILE